MVFNGSGTQNIATILQGVNEITGNAFGGFVVLLIGVITYSMLGREPTRETFTASTFTMMVGSILLSVLGVVNEVTLGLTVAAFVGSLVMLVVRQ